MKKIVKPCVICGKNVEIVVTDEQALELESPNRRFIQEILPTHTTEEREMFISGICGECFDSMLEDMYGACEEC